jgi:DNA polymerase-3 subunit gamma/tau
VALALYRKYRSADFSELIGQSHVTEPLMQALSAGRINHAYLFSGPRGCGKTSSARILARSLNCAQGPTPTPCGVCASCVDLAPNGSGSIDVIEIDAASHGGVDDARDLRERAYYAPARDRYKVYIIDEAHMVTTQGFNALLKLVEEPPDFLVFIFATTEPDKVLTTIRSRTHHYPFRLIAPSVLRAHLERICALENAIVEPTVFSLVVRSGGGSARDSLSILDQLIAGAGPAGVTYAMAVGLLGVTDAGLLDDMTQALAAGDERAAYASIDRVVEAGHDPRRFAADLLERFRDLIMLDAIPDAAAIGLIDYPADQAGAMADLAHRTGTASLVRFADITHTTLTEMRGTTSPRLMLELLSARMLLPDASSDSMALLQRMERLERRLGVTAPDLLVAPTAGAGSVPAGAKPAVTKPAVVEPAVVEHTVVEHPVVEHPAVVEPAAVAAMPEAVVPEAVAPEPAAPEPAAPEPAAPEPAAPEPAAAGQPDSSGLRRLWPDVLDQVRRQSRRTRALLDNAAIARVDGNLITLSATSAPLAKMISDDSNLSVLRAALDSVVGGGWSIRVDTDPGAAVAAADKEPFPPGDGGPREDRPSSGAPAEQSGGPQESDAARDSAASGSSPAPEAEAPGSADAAGPDDAEPPAAAKPPGRAVSRPSDAARAAVRARADKAPGSTRPAQKSESNSRGADEADGVDEASDVVRSSSSTGATSVEDAAIALLRESLGAQSLSD